jgi:hypothetical protein
MPSFFGYRLYASLVPLPLFGLLTFLPIAPSWRRDCASEGE